MAPVTSTSRTKTAHSLRAPTKAEVAGDGGAPKPVATRYSGVADALKAEIASGLYEVGTKLPTEFELCGRFEVSRSTVRQALAELEATGIVKRRQGSGTTVVARAPALRYSLSIATEADILRFASETVLEITDPAAAVSAADSRRLRLGSPNEWRVWRGLRRATNGGPPLGRVGVYLPTRYLETMKALERRPQRAIFDYVANAHGIAVTAIEQEISATVLDANEADILQTPPGAPALSIVRRFVGEQELIEVSETILPADRFSYEIRLAREQLR